MSDERGPADILRERPDLAPAFEAVLAAEETTDGWTFDDIDIDSGRFGELVSRGIVEKDDSTYSVADPTAVRRALKADTDDGDTDESDASDTATESDSEPVTDDDTATESGGVGISGLIPKTPDIDGLTDRRYDPSVVGFFAAALAVVVVSRAYVVPRIYRGGDIVLSGNDPYYYRYHVEQAAAAAGGAGDLLEGLATGTGEPLMVATLWFISELFGGTPESIGHVMTWYPVVAVLISAILTYLLAVRVTRDRRVGLAAVLFMSTIPEHAFRTSVGYADHHAFDYVWLGITALAVLMVVTTATDKESLREYTPWLAGLGIAVGVAGQILAWGDGGPLLIVPVGLVVAAKTLLDIRADRSVIPSQAPIIAGLFAGSSVVLITHLSLGWISRIAAVTPLVLMFASVATVGVGKVVQRFSGTAKHALAVYIVGPTLGFVIMRVLAPTVLDEVLGSASALFNPGSSAFETAGLFASAEMWSLSVVGFVLLLAVPILVRAGQYAVRDHTGWLVLVIYGWFFLLLSVLQIRFAGELTTFISIFAGYGFVWIGSRYDLIRPVVFSRQDGIRNTAVPSLPKMSILLVLFLLISSAGAHQADAKIDSIVTNEGIHQTATALEEISTAQNRQYPDNYVFSRWGFNRVYNYFVSGESDSYKYAQNNYEPFIKSAGSEEEWYNRLRGRCKPITSFGTPNCDIPSRTYNAEGPGTVGYVVMEFIPIPSGLENSMQARLWQSYGSRTAETAGLSHFRALYASPDRYYRAFELVPGAVIEGRTSPNTRVTVATQVQIPNAQFNYIRQTRADSNGTYRIDVANPGEYTVRSSGQNTTVAVNATAVQTGQTVSLAE